MERRVLCLDCDGVIFDTNNIYKELTAGINYCCSDDFKDKVIDRALQYNDEETAKIYTRIQIITRDEVLEELKDVYKERIPYQEMYVFENTFPGVVSLIKEIWETGYFDKIYITSHVNTVRESLAKKEFFSKYLPMVEVFTLQFKDQPYDYDINNYFKNAERLRTNKPLEFFKARGENPNGTLLVDDSESICKQAVDLGAKSIWVDNEKKTPLFVFHSILETVKEAIKQDNIDRKGRTM